MAGERRDWPFGISMAAAGSEVTVTVTGELDLATSPELRRALRQAIADGATSLRLDVSGLTFCDAAGLSPMVAARHAAERAGASFELVDPPPHLRRLLSLLHLDAQLRGS